MRVGTMKHPLSREGALSPRRGRTWVTLYQMGRAPCRCQLPDLTPSPPGGQPLGRSYWGERPGPLGWRREVFVAFWVCLPTDDRFSFL